MVLLIVVFVHQIQSIKTTPPPEAGLHHPCNPNYSLPALQYALNADG
jgi:hypothetical protein